MKLKSSLKIIPGFLLLTLPHMALGGTETSQPVVGSPADPDQQIKCRKIQVTGSLIRKGRVCRTIAEWRRLQQLGNDAARAVAGEQICSGGDCRGYEPPPVPE